MIERLGRGLAVALAVCLLAAFAAACGGSSGGATVTVTESTEATEPAEAEAGSEEAAEEEASGGGASEALAGISTPPGSELLGSKEGASVVYQHYKTSTEPKAVASFYEEELTSAGWSIESSGGSGGGWGSYGGSDYGLTAKREDDYFDLEAGGEKNSESYFELCAGPGTRAECEKLSQDENDSNSGGSGGNDNENESNSGGS